MRVTRGPITLAFSLERDVDLPLGQPAGELALSSDPRISVRDAVLHLVRDGVAIVRRD